MRLSEIDALFQTSEGKAQLCTAFQSMRNSRRFVATFRLQEHPEWLQLTSKPRSQQVGTKKLCNLMLYSADTSSMFVQHKETRKLHDRRQNQIKAAQKRAFSEPISSVSFQNVLQKAQADHMVEFLRPGEYYSLPASVATDSKVLQPLACFDWGRLL